MREETSFSRGERGFTLLEVLAVMSILLVLGALALSGVRRVTEQGKSAKCIALTRQLSLATAAYAAENNGDVCGAGPILDPQGNVLSQWPTRIAPYFESANFADESTRPKFICPAHPKYIRDMPLHVNWAFNVKCSPTTKAGEFTVVRKMNQFANPAKLLFAIDGYRVFGWESGDGQDPAFTYPPTTNITVGNRIFFPHSGKATGLFLDGHIETLKAPLPREICVVE